MTRLSDCQAALKTCQAQVLSLKTANANLTAKVADLQAQLDATKPVPDPIPDPVPPPSGDPTPGFTDLPAPPMWYPTSVFNKPITANPAVHPNSQNIVAYLLTKGPVPTISMRAGRGGTQYDYSHVIYQASATDPVVTLHGSQGWQPDVQIRVPAGAREAAFNYSTPPGGATIDKSMCVIQADGTEWDMWGVESIASGRIVCGFYGKNTTAGTGLSGGITEAKYALGLGVIRVDEMVQGEIKHALFCTTNGWSGRVYPAQPSSKTGQGSGANRPAMGAHLQLDPSMSLASYPKWQQIVLRALQTHGAYVGDNGGGDAPFWMQLESETPYVALKKSPTNLQYLDTHFGHSGAWDIGSGVDWSRMRVLQPPTP